MPAPPTGRTARLHLRGELPGKGAACGQATWADLSPEISPRGHAPVWAGYSQFFAGRTEASPASARSPCPFHERGRRCYASFSRPILRRSMPKFRHTRRKQARKLSHASHPGQTLLRSSRHANATGGCREQVGRNGQGSNRSPVIKTSLSTTRNRHISRVDPHMYTRSCHRALPSANTGETFPARASTPITSHPGRQADDQGAVLFEERMHYVFRSPPPHTRPPAGTRFA